jgi:hypothetical protein
MCQFQEYFHTQHQLKIYFYLQNCFFIYSISFISQLPIQSTSKLCNRKLGQKIRNLFVFEKNGSNTTSFFFVVNFYKCGGIKIINYQSEFLYSIISSDKLDLITDKSTLTCKYSHSFHLASGVFAGLTFRFPYITFRSANCTCLLAYITFINNHLIK